MVTKQMWQKEMEEKDEDVSMNRFMSCNDPTDVAELKWYYHSQKEKKNGSL